MILNNFIDWDEKYIVGVDSIDKQHKLLVDQLNTTFVFFNEDKILIALDALERFVVTIENHFTAEEIMMQKREYPAADEHYILHAKLLHQIKKLYEFIREDKAILNLEVFDFLKSWLLDHIQQSDKELGNFLNLQ